MLLGVDGYYNVSDGYAVSETSCDTGIDNGVNAEFINKYLSADSGVDLSYARENDYNFLVSEASGKKLISGLFKRAFGFHRAFYKSKLFGHGAYYAYFIHLFTPSCQNKYILTHILPYLK